MRHTIRIHASQACPLCRDGVRNTPPPQLLVCSACKTLYHRDCFHEFGGTCGVLGCEKAQAPARRTPPRGIVTRQVAASEDLNVGTALGVALLLFAKIMLAVLVHL